MKITMYKNLFLLFIAVIAVSAGFSNQVLAQVFYSDPIDGYSFDLPNGWEEIPKSVIDQYIDDVVRQTQGQRIEYTAGFQLNEKNYFQYPYILIQEHSVNTPSYSQIERVLHNINFDDLTQKGTAEYSELLTSATVEKPFVDKERNIIFMNIELDVANIGKVNGLTAMFLGKQGITQLNFYAVSSEYSQWIPIFDSVIDSFRYETAYAYNPAEAVKNDSPSLFEGVAEKGFFGVIIGGIMGLLAGLIWIIRIGWNFLEKKNKDTEQRNEKEDERIFSKK